MMDGNNEYILKTEEHKVDLHYVSLSKEDENGWKRISLLSCNGVNTNYREMEIRIYPKSTEIKEVAVSNINNNTYKNIHNDDGSFTLLYKGDSIYNLSDVSDIFIKVVDTENKILENWDLNINLSLIKRETKIRKLNFRPIGYMLMIILFMYLILSNIDINELICLVRK